MRHHHLGIASIRRQASWPRCHAFRDGGLLHYRRRDGALFEQTPSHAELGRGLVYSSASFVREAPLKAYFDFTNRCNLSCRHCITSSSPQVDTSTELPTARILTLVSELADIGVLEIAVGGGEPLIHPDWVVLFEHVTSVGINLIITTNGLKVTSTVVDVMQQIAPLEVRVSFDGGPGLHEHIRGPGTYLKAMKALTLLTASGLRAAARLTLCQGADSELPQLFSDLSQAGAKAVKVAVIKPAGRAATHTGMHLLGYRSSEQAVASLMTLGRAQGLRVQLSSDDFPVSATVANDPKLRDSDQPNCGAGFETCYISPRGQLLGCVTIPQIGLGDLHATPFLEVWSSRQAAAYRHRAAATDQRRLCDAFCSQVGGLADGSVPLMTLSPLPRQSR